MDPLSSPQARRGIWRLLVETPNLRNLWCAQVVSQMGDWLNRLAILTLLGRVGGLELELGIGLLFGLELFLRLLPGAFVSPLAGGVADRVPRRTLMIAADVLRAGIVLAFLFVDEPGELWLLYVLLTAQVSVAVFFESARSATMAEAVPAEDLQTAYALSAATWSTTLALGAALGGILAEELGTNTVFVLDASTYLVSVAFLLRVTVGRKVASRDPFSVTEVVLLRDVRAGWRHVRAKGVERNVLAKAAWGGAGGFLCLLSIAGKVTWDEVIGAGKATGYLLTARGIGTGIGPVITRAVFSDSDSSLRWQISAGFLVGAFGYAWFALHGNIWLACLAVAFAHTGGSVLWVSGTVLWQRAVDDAYRGRVHALEMFAMTWCFGSSALLTGALFDRLGRVDWTTWIVSAFVVACGLGWTMYDRRAARAATSPIPDSNR